jgi:hypothetical protein
MQKDIQPTELAGMPIAYQACFDVLAEAAPGAPVVLFGGSVRDADYAAYYREPRPIKDYDLRILLPDDNHAERIAAFAAALAVAARNDVREVPSPGTERIRHCVDLDLGNLGIVDMDVSVRKASTIPNLHSEGIAALAKERVSESDIGLSSIVLASDGIAWASREYQQDRNDRTLSVYPRPNAESRLRAYSKRMQQKFPDHTVIWL